MIQARSCGSIRFPKCPECTVMQVHSICLPSLAPSSEYISSPSNTSNLFSKEKQKLQNKLEKVKEQVSGTAINYKEMMEK